MKKEQIFGVILIVILILFLWTLIYNGGLKKLVTGNFHSVGELFSTSTPATSYTTHPSASRNAESIPSDASPLYRKVRIASLSITSQGGAVLTLQSVSPQAIDITGWRIETSIDTELVPQVPEFYLLSGSGSLQDVVLQKGDRVTLSSNFSPVRENVRVNVCMGYLLPTLTFTPPLSMGCFVPPPEELAGLSGQCRAFIARIPACVSVHRSDGQDFDASCRAYLDTLNYEGCIRAHQQSATFKKGDWRVWIGVQFVSQAHDTVVLRDREGKLVDESSY